MAKSSSQIKDEIETVLAKGEWQSGFDDGREMALDEWSRYDRKTVRETLEQLQAHARSTAGQRYVHGQVAGYAQALIEIDQRIMGGVKASPLPQGSAKGVKVDTSAYRRDHGTQPKGRGDWTFVIGKISYERPDDPALYRPAHERGVSSLPFSKAKEYAVAEAKHRGEFVVGLSS